jgi:adenylate cyclase
MTDNSIQRKLRAIFSADVKGYSKLMGDDDEHTINTITAYREIIAGFIQKHQGRVVDTPGDNILAEFSSALNAVKSAVETQQTLEIENGKLPDNRRMEFRIGINLGDILHKDDRIYGDGVNVAARIESLADPGGICISRGVFDQVKKKVPHGFEYLGERAVKNISNPVRIYKVLTKPEYVGKIIGEKRFLGRISRKVAITAILTLGIVTGGLISYYIYLHQSGRIEPAVVENMAHPLPDLPSIAVLPFDNMSGDLEQEYLSDGITEEIITGLSKIPRLFVIARNSSFTYKGKPVKVQQVGEELGVQYVLEGSFRKMDNRARFTVQLVDTINGHHIWAETYESDMDDIFAVQDQITFKVVAALQVELTEGEQALMVAGRTSSFAAYAKFLRGLEYIKYFNKEGNLLARKMAEEAIAIDPNYPRGYRLLASTHFLDVRLGMSKDPKRSLSIAAELYQKVISMDPSDAVAYSFLGLVYTTMGKHEAGVAEVDKAVAVGPNAADAHALYAMVYHFSGRNTEAIEAIRKAIRLNPLPPNWYFANSGLMYSFAGLYDEAFKSFQEALGRQPDNLPCRISLAVAYSLANKENSARAEIKEVLRLNPAFSIQMAMKSYPYQKQSDKDTFLNALRKAGLPETLQSPIHGKP